MSMNTIAQELVSKKMTADMAPPAAAAAPAGAAAPATAAPKPPSRDDGVAALTKYIPTESLTMYVAVVSSQKALETVSSTITAASAYKFFIVLTPLIMLGLYFRGLALAGHEWKLPPRSWPWWRMIAATVAFSAWALAIPGNPVIDPQSQAGGAVAALAALFVSMFLSLLAPLFERQQS
ncbi:MAG TPA: hypothetical protein VNI58_10720 [Mariprofundaceae bacterium]|nr:hypothetical protein [Mariprofundaceae bacterium]